MGRRKIEIQPILHERNRAVTFLKRKNGLFKKAYELGVLCSVDVAVIIFEERPGHHLKLYQYCSTDIQDMVQRHLRYEGEKDTRGPADFSGNTAKHLDDVGDGDDDDADDDDGDSGIRGGHKRRGDGRMKQPPPLTVGGPADMGYSRIAVPTMSMPGLQPPGSSSGLPISRDREIMHGGAPNMGQNKRARVEPPGHSRSSSDDPTSGPGGSGGAAYFNSSSSSYRHQQPYHAGSVNHQYGSYFVGSQTSPPPSFIPLQQEYSTRGTASSPAAGSGGPTSAGGGAGGGAGGAGGGHYGARQQQYDPSLYSPSIIRHPHQAQQHGNGPGGGGSDMYPVFQLEADGGQRQSTVTPSQPFGIEWPIHSSNSAAAAAAASAATAPSGPASSVSTASSAAPSSAGGDSNWLDFLSGNSANAGAGGAGAGAGEPPRSSMSWERGHEVEMFSGTASAGSGSGAGASGGNSAGEQRPGSGRGGTSTSPMLSTGKRGREGHGAGAGGGEADDGSAQGASGHHPSSKLKKVTPTIPVMLQEANANHDSNPKVLPPHLFSRGGGVNKRVV